MRRVISFYSCVDKVSTCTWKVYQSFYYCFRNCSLIYKRVEIIHFVKEFFDISDMEVYFFPIWILYVRNKSNKKFCNKYFDKTYDAASHVVNSCVTIRTRLDITRVFYIFLFGTCLARFMLYSFSTVTFVQLFILTKFHRRVIKYEKCQKHKQSKNFLNYYYQKL